MNIKLVKEVKQTEVRTMMNELFGLYEKVYGKVEDKDHWYDFMAKVMNGWSTKKLYKYMSSLKRWAIKEGRI